MNRFDELIERWNHRASEFRYNPRDYVETREEVVKHCIEDLKDILLLIEADEIGGIKKCGK